MPVRYLQPFRSDKDLGKAYNEEIAFFQDHDHICLRDIDTLLLSPNTPKIIEWYASQHPNAVLTCYTNRISTLSRKQLMNQQVSDNADIRYHISIAERQEALTSVSQIKHPISGFLMVFRKALWLRFPFPETGKCLGVDTEWSQKILAAGIPILRMNGVYVWHTYRLKNGITDKTHLQ